MRRTLQPVLLAVLVLLSALTVYAQSEVSVTNETGTTYNTVSGPGAAQSSLSPDGSYLNTLSVRANGTVKGYNFFLNVGGKGTDDARTDVRPLTLSNLQARFTNQTHTLTLGDCFESYSQYGLSSSVKGLSYRYTNAEAAVPDINVLYGVAYPRWDNFSGNSAVKAIRRTVYGMHATRPVTPVLTVGASLVKTNDSDRITATDTLYDGKLASLDWNYAPFPGLTVQGESAFSNSDGNDGTATTSAHGSAHRIEAVGDGGPSRVTLQFERTSAGFLSLMGSATSDREKAAARWRYKETKLRTWNLNLLWYRDNLNNAKSVTTQHFKPEVSLALRRPFSRLYASTTLTTRFDHTEGAADSNNLYSDVNYRDRFGIFDSDTTVGLNHYSTTGNVRKSNEMIVNTALSTRITRGTVIYKPTLYLGTSNCEDELANATDRTYEYSLGLGIDLPEHNLTSQLKIGQNQLLKDTGGDDTTKFFASGSLYYSPTFLSRTNANQLFLRGMYNNFDFTTGTNNFRETSLTGGMNIQF